MPRTNTTPVCRYFTSGQCKFGSSCTFSHDRSVAPSMICRFNDRGSCVFGTACRYDHVNPRREERKMDKETTSLSTKPSATTAKPKMKPPSPSRTNALNADAAEFVPSWLQIRPESYAQAAGSTFNQEDYDILPPLCPYHELGNCVKGDKCEMIHGDQCPYCMKNLLHPLDEGQRILHNRDCVRMHEEQMQLAFLEQRSKEKSCGICLENICDKNLRFGILESCQHCFCVGCIREWRKKKDDTLNENIKTCPLCRQRSDFVVPSVIWVEEKEEKEVLFKMYQENTKQKPCKYYKPYSNGECPFGNNCFYSHTNPDGSAAEYQIPRRRKLPVLSDFMHLSDDEEEAALFISLTEDAERGFSELSSLISRILSMSNRLP